ncbi:sigma-70 family RNA polymerase sigma factor [Verrucomicrobiaceae bacterium 227]
MAQPFPDTRWTLIQKARIDADGCRALDEWCRNYWPPVYTYICSRGYDSESAKELTQSFFERLIARGAEESLPHQLSGAFRAYLMRSVKNFLTDQWRSSKSQRRGGDQFQVEPEVLEKLSDGQANPEQAFDQKWALTVIELAMKKLEAELEEKGKGELFDKTKHLLDGRSVNDEDRSELARSLGLKDGAFRVTLHRIRGRFRTLIEEEVRETVSSQEDYQEELCYLFRVWS